jgi:hypothetical protein
LSTCEIGDDCAVISDFVSFDPRYLVIRDAAPRGEVGRRPKYFQANDRA